MGTRVYFAGGEAASSPPSSAEVTRAWSYTSTPPIRLHGVVFSKKKHKDFTFTFTFTLIIPYYFYIMCIFLAWVLIERIVLLDFIHRLVSQKIEE
jgi:hypothetical protein